MPSILQQQFERYKKANPNELTPLELVELQKELNKPSTGASSDQHLDFLLWCNGHPSRQELFAKYLMKYLPKRDGVKVLEVGCGRTAKLSRILAEKGFIMTCIDPKVDTSLLNGITSIKAKFDYRKFDLSEYDFIIAQEPCDATEHIIRACTSHDKPFIVSLCGTPHKLLSGEMPKNYQDWFDYLWKIARDKTKLVYLSLDPFSKTPIIRSNQF